MDVKNKMYLEELIKLDLDLEEYEKQVKDDKIKPDLGMYRSKLLRVYELKYLDVAIRGGANEEVQYEILNLTLKEKQGLV